MSHEPGPEDQLEGNLLGLEKLVDRNHYSAEEVLDKLRARLEDDLKEEKIEKEKSKHETLV